MALVRDECLLPCRDAPELGYAKESSSEQYVPDVFYKASISIGLCPCSSLGTRHKDRSNSLLFLVGVRQHLQAMGEF